MIKKYFLFLSILFFPFAGNLLTSDFPKAGLYIKAFPENSILYEIFTEYRNSKFYLLEFNGNRIPDPSSPSGNLNFKIVLKSLYELCSNPPKNDFTKLTILEDKNGFLTLHLIEIRPWDGLISIEEKTKNFSNLENIEKVYHNSFKYLQSAKKFLNEKNFEEAKRYLKLIKMIDPQGSETKESDLLKIKIDFEEKLLKAQNEEKQKNFQEALKIYEESKKIYFENIEILKEMENFEKELDLKIEEIKNKMAEIERLKKEEERLKAERDKEERERLEALKIQKEKEEKEREIKQQKEKEEKLMKEKQEREEKISMLLNKFRISRRNKEFEKAEEIMNELNKIAGDDERVKGEISKFEREIFEEYLSKSKEFFKKNDFINSLKYLYSADNWNPNNEEVLKMKEKIKEKIKSEEIKEEYLVIFLFKPSRDTNFIIFPPANPAKYVGQVFLWGGILKEKNSNIYIAGMSNQYVFCFKADFPIDVSFNRYVKVIGAYLGNIDVLIGSPIPCLLAIWVGY